MMALDKVTFGYSRVEDRISLSSQSFSGEQIRLWLTYRLVRQFIPHLIKLAATDMPGSDDNAVNEGKGEGCPHFVSNQTEVECGEDSPELLVREIGLTQREDTLLITFRGYAPRDPAVLALSFDAVHKTVEALQMFSEKAGWQLTGKPPDMSQLVAMIGRDITIH